MKKYWNANITRDMGATIEANECGYLVIAVDPDIQMSGMAIVDKEEGKVYVGKYAFPELISEILEEAAYITAKWVNKCAVVYIEGGWLNESNWHIPKGASGHYGAAIGESVGRNHAVGMLLEQMMKAMGIECQVVKPLPKTMRIGRTTLARWKGRDGKITKDELDKLIARLGLEIVPMEGKRINQDMRDAVLLALHYAGYSF